MRISAAHVPLFARLFAAIVVGTTLLGIGLHWQISKGSRAEESSQHVNHKSLGDSTGGRFELLWIAILEFRGKCALEGEPGWDDFATKKARKKIKKLNRQIWDDYDIDCGWSYFFSTALFDVAKPNSEAPVVGFYHPWSDTWVVTQWQVGQIPRITDVAVLCGDWVRRRGMGPLDIRPDWLRRDGFRVEQLARATAESIDVFDRVLCEPISWREALRLDVREDFLMEANTLTASRNLLQGCLRASELAVGDPEQPALQELIEATTQFLDAGRSGRIAPVLKAAGKTSPDSAKLLGNVTPDAFATLVPTYWLADPQGAIALFVPETNPDFCIALSYERENKTLRLLRADFLHFPTIIKIADNLAAKESK